MSYFKSVSVPATQPQPDTFEACEHVTADWSLAVQGTAETDVWGSDIPYFCCQKCVDLQGEEIHESPCEDCGAEVKVSEMREWRWYDFYAPQGDEPVYICKGCQLGPKHRKRIKEDSKARDAEWDDY